MGRYWCNGQTVDEAVVFRAMGGERLPLTTAERIELVRRLTVQEQLSALEIAQRLGVARRTVVRHRAAIRDGHPLVLRGTRRVPRLLDRELRALRLVAEGFESWEIADELGTTADAVGALLQRAQRRCGARNRANLLWIAVQAGLLGDGEPS